MRVAVITEAPGEVPGDRVGELRTMLLADARVERSTLYDEVLLEDAVRADSKRRRRVEVRRDDPENAWTGPTRTEPWTVLHELGLTEFSVVESGGVGGVGYSPDPEVSGLRLVDRASLARQDQLGILRQRWNGPLEPTPALRFFPVRVGVTEGQRELFSMLTEQTDVRRIYRARESGTYADDDPTSVDCLYLEFADVPGSLAECLARRWSVSLRVPLTELWELATTQTLPAIRRAGTIMWERDARE